MKKFKYVLFILLFFIYFDVKAIDSCTTDEMNRLKELANNVEIKYQYEIIEDEETKQRGFDDYFNAIFKIEVLNMNDDLRIFLEDSLGNFNKFITLDELKEIEFIDGDVLSFKIYSYTTNLCTRKILKTINLKLPIYNDYYYLNKDKCVNNEDFKYCKELLDKDIELSDEEIDELFEKYIKEKESNNKSSQEINNQLKSIISNYYYLIIIPIIIIAIIIVVKKKKKNKDI